MKQGAPRGGTVDGIRKDSLSELGKACGSTDGAISKYVSHHGLTFTYHGHKVVIDPPSRRKPIRPRYDDEDEARPERKPLDILSIALAARRNYDERGQSRHGLLMLRAQ